MSFHKAQQLYRRAEMAPRNIRVITLRKGMGEFDVEERTARRMFRQFEGLFTGVQTRDDGDRRSWWTFTDVSYVQHRVLRENELAALDLAIRRAARDGDEGRWITCRDGCILRFHMAIAGFSIMTDMPVFLAVEGIQRGQVRHCAT